mmetsp:Transcript_94530/g.272233  ORF Transcript_94530/g.272233 Transcript_94530/m.272233 type:complete len:105 (-) Transcript_94530:101-415(-)
MRWDLQSSNGTIDIFHRRRLSDLLHNLVLFIGNQNCNNRWIRRRWWLKCLLDYNFWFIPSTVIVCYYMVQGILVAVGIAFLQSFAAYPASLAFGKAIRIFRIQC